MTVKKFIELCKHRNVSPKHKFISYRASSIVITQERDGREFIVDDVLMRHITFGGWCERLERMGIDHGTIMVESWPTVMSLKVEDIAIDKHYIKL